MGVRGGRDAERRDTRRFAVISASVPGRARLHVPTLRRQPALALQLQERLRRDDRIRHVGASAITGNVLVLFDRSRLDLREVRRQLELEAATYRPVRAFEARVESPLEKTAHRREPAVAYA